MIQKQLQRRSGTGEPTLLRDFWISCNMNALDSIEFKSKTRSSPQQEGNDGVTLAFLSEFMKYFANQSIGIDLSDVNF